MRKYIAVNGFSQNLDGDLSKSQRTYPDKVRYVSKKLIERNLINGKKIIGDFLVYSPSTAKMYCAPCRLFGVGGTGDSQFAHGFNDWKNAESRVSHHEKATGHMNCLIALKQRANFAGRIDLKITQQMEEEIKY